MSFMSYGNDCTSSHRVNWSKLRQLGGGFAGSYWYLSAGSAAVGAVIESEPLVKSRWAFPVLWKYHFCGTASGGGQALAVRHSLAPSTKYFATGAVTPLSMPFRWWSYHRCFSSQMSSRTASLP